MSSKLTARRGNPGTPKVCKSKPPPIPQPPSAPICDPSTLFIVQLLTDWDEAGTHYHAEPNYTAAWNPANARYEGTWNEGQYWSYITITPHGFPGCNLRIETFTWYAGTVGTNAAYDPIPCDQNTPRTWCFPPWTWLFPADANHTLQLTATTP